MFVRHHLRPGVFWQLPRGEQLFLAASMEIERSRIGQGIDGAHLGEREVGGTIRVVAGGEVPVGDPR